VDTNLHPYVVFLPSTEKNKTLSAIFGSKAAVEILRHSLKQGISNRLYQKDLIDELSFSSKTIIENLKSLTKLRVLDEDMEKTTSEGRVVWVKTYQLSDLGKWFALLLAEERDLSKQETAEILQNLFRSYVRWVADLAQKVGMNKESLTDIFQEEISH
jgi:DNA-binding PadR family transcriptional regulator